VIVRSHVEFPIQTKNEIRDMKAKSLSCKERGAACPKKTCVKYKRKGKIHCRKRRATEQAMRMKAGAKAWRAHKKELKNEPLKGAYQKFIIPYMTGKKK